MKKNRTYLVRLLLTFTAVFAVVLLFQLRASSVRDSAAPVHMPVDWSFRHLIYSGPPTGPHAWEAMQDPRYLRHLSIYATRERNEQDRWGSGDWFDRRWQWPVPPARRVSPETGLAGGSGLKRPRLTIHSVTIHSPRNLRSISTPCRAAPTISWCSPPVWLGLMAGKPALWRSTSSTRAAGDTAVPASLPSCGRTTRT